MANSINHLYVRPYNKSTTSSSSFGAVAIPRAHRPTPPPLRRHPSNSNSNPDMRNVNNIVMSPKNNKSREDPPSPPPVPPSSPSRVIFLDDDCTI